MSFNIEQIKNVLVLVPDKHMGDLVLALSTIKELKDFFKEKTFTLVVDNKYSEIIETIDGLNNVLFYPRKRLNGNSFIRRLPILLDFFRQLRNTSPDLAIDLQGKVASSTMAFLSGAPLRVGRLSAKRSYLYNLKIKHLKGHHKLYSYKVIASAVGVQSKNGIYRVKASEGKISSLKSILLEEGITMKKPIICIHPGAGVIYKQWTEKGFAEISDWLSSEGFQVVFVGGNRDLEVINKIMTLLKHHSYNLGGKLSLGELMVLFEISSIYIGNDSGPMHLADAIGTSVIALFGPADEKRWGPTSEKSIVLRGDKPCPKCKGKDCDYDFKCIRTLTAERVKDAINKFISSELLWKEYTRL